MSPVNRGRDGADVEVGFEEVEGAVLGADEIVGAAETEGE